MKRAVLILIPVLLVTTLVTAVYTEQRQASLNEMLVEAVNSPDAAQVETALDQGADPDFRDWSTYRISRDPLFRPPWYERYVARIMRRKPRTADPYIGPTVLMIAADHGDVVVVNSLLKHGANLTKTGTNLEDDRDSNGYIVSPLWEAAKEGDLATVQTLLSYGAPVDGRGGGLTPLMNTEDLDISAALIKAGADVNAVSLQPVNDDSAGDPLLEQAIKGGHEGEGDRNPNLKLVALLLENGAKVNARDSSGGTPLMAACEAGSSEAAKLLVSFGADVNAHDQLSSGTALLYSTYTPEIERFLLARGASVNARDNDGKTALEWAAYGGHTETLKLLLDAGANPNLQDVKGQTALMLASYLDYDFPDGWQKNRAERLRLLRQHGANPNLKDKTEKTAANYFNPQPPDPPGS